MSSERRQLALFLDVPLRLKNTPQRERTMLWMLRVYGPCAFALLAKHCPFPRNSAWAALRRLRQKGLADRCKAACYRITADGRKAIEKYRPLFETRSTRRLDATAAGSRNERWNHL